MKSSFQILSDIFSVLEPNKDVALLEINAIQDEDGVYHLAPGIDALEYVLHRLLSGSLRCEPEGVSKPIAASLLQALSLCKNCDETPAAMLHSIVDKELGHAARILYELQIFSSNPNPDRVELFIANRSGREILALASILMTQELDLRFRTEYLEDLGNESYSSIINSIIESNFALLDSYRSLLTSAESTTKIRSHLEIYEMESNPEGIVTVVLAGLGHEAIDQMSDTSARNSEDRGSNTNTILQSKEHHIMVRDALTLQYLFAPEVNLHSSAILVPAWLTAAISYLNPKQILSPVFAGLSESEADTAKRLYTFDMSSIFSEMSVCVSTAISLNNISD